MWSGLNDGARHRPVDGGDVPHVGVRRLDVRPVDDLGVRKGYGLAWRLDPPPTAKDLERW